MAKASGLPSIDVEDAPKTLPERMKQPEKDPVQEAPSLETAIIEAPLGPVVEGGYIARRERVEFSSMTRKQSLGLHRLTRGLQDSGVMLEDGTKIKRSGQAVRWFLEQLGQ